MCDRFSLVEVKLIHKTFHVANRQLELLPHYNVAPSQSILAVRNDEENHRKFSLGITLLQSKSSALNILMRFFLRVLIGVRK
jgi:putative SOS response-associated peptidase YedK